MKTTGVLGLLLGAATAAPSHHGGLIQPRETRSTSINWSGAVAQGKDITSVSATFPILEPGIPSKAEQGKHAYSGAVWLGIDGYNKTVCPEGLWQAGIMTQHHNITGETWIQAWYEWYPESPVWIDMGNLTAGDMIKMSLDAEDTLRPSLHMENLNTGGSFDITVNGTRPLCRSSAEWIVERSYTLSGLVGLLDFGTERFTDIAYTVDGEVVDKIPDHVTVLDIINDELNNTVQTHTEVSADYIEVTYLDV